MKIAGKCKKKTESCRDNAEGKLTAKFSAFKSKICGSVSGACAFLAVFTAAASLRLLVAKRFCADNRPDITAKNESGRVYSEGK